MSRGRPVLVVAEQLRRPVPGGIGTYVRGLLQGLRAMGEERPAVTLLASRSPARPDPLAELGFPMAGAALPGRVLTRLWDRQLVRAPHLPPHGLVHACSLAFPVPRAAPLTVLVHDLAWREVPEAFPERGRRWHEAALQRALRHARLLLAPSQRTAEGLLEAGAAPDRVAVVEEGCDHLPAPDPAATRAHLERLGVDGPFLMAVGTREPRKNLTRLVAAYRQARPQLPEPWPLVVIGPRGWGDAGFHGAVDPDDGVVVAGVVPDGVLAGLLAGARCLAYVPVAEGFGLPPVEAMAAGCPVVASTAVPSTAGAALEVDPRDEGAIAEAMVAAAVDGSVRERLIGAGRARAAELTWEAAARAHVARWEAL